MILNDIKSSKLRFCIRCNCFLTKENDSEWEVFIDKTNITFPICKICHEKQNDISDKA